MKVIDQDPGEPFDLYSSDELQRDIQAFHDRQCRHATMKVRRVTVAGGATQFRQQCSACGELVGQAISRTSVPPNVLPSDSGLAQRYRDSHQAEYQSIIQQHVRKQKTHDTEWCAKYEAYLQSSEWKVKRDKVLKRANGKCKGCGERVICSVTGSVSV